MTPEREKLIRAYWPKAQQYGFGHGPVVKVPVWPKVEPPKDPVDITKPQSIETLAYELKRDWRDGQRWAQVVCEGVVVAEGPA